MLKLMNTYYMTWAAMNDSYSSIRLIQERTTFQSWMHWQILRGYVPEDERIQI